GSAHEMELRAPLAWTATRAGGGPLSSIMRDVQELEPLVERCSDDALHALLAIGQATASLREVERAAAVVDAVPQDDLLAEIDMLRAHQTGGDHEAAIAAYERAVERFGHRSRPHGQARAVIELLDVLLTR